jgi:hypothetical protein|nr:MAG TPA: hypothetical protein [Caudoviricetes sp.]
MNKELLLIFKTLRKADGGVLLNLCYLMECHGIHCDCCPVNRTNYTYSSPAINIRYIKTIEVLIEQ